MPYFSPPLREVGLGIMKTVAQGNRSAEIPTSAKTPQKWGTRRDLSG